VQPFIRKGLTAFIAEVPKGLCREKSDRFDDSKGGGGGEGTLPATSAVAILDELSTFGMMMFDQNHRPGKSIHLTTEIVGHIPADSKIKVETETAKIGLTLGFCNMKIYTIEGELVARGQHIKYMPMGLGWDIFTHKWLVNMSLKLLESGFFGTKVGKMLGGSFFDVAEDLDKFDTSITSIKFAEVFEKFQLQKVDSEDIKELKLLNNLDKNEIFSFFVKPDMINVVGDLHGGCVAMICEQASVLTLENLLRKQEKKKKGSEVEHGFVSQQVETRYLSAMNGELFAICRVLTPPDKDRKGAVVEGDIINRKGQIGYQFTIHF
jgi:acyl-coenzyme A thioesterase PaaI-like protein